MPPIRLADVDRDDALTRLPNWSYDPARNALYRALRFEDFATALSAMVRIGIAAEIADHHPEWTHVYDRVDIWLTTHDAGGVSPRDIALATQINRLFPSS